MQLQQSLASAFIAAKGFGAEETTQAFNRALQLCEKLEGSPQIFAVLNGMAGVHLMRGEFEHSRGAAEDCSRAHDALGINSLLMGHRVLGMSLFMIGELSAARRKLRDASTCTIDRCMRRWRLSSHMISKLRRKSILRLHPCLSATSRMGCHMGVRRWPTPNVLRHPHSVCYVLSFSSQLHISGRRDVVGRLSPTAVACNCLVRRIMDFPPSGCAPAISLGGWARADIGEAASGLHDLSPASISANERVTPCHR